MSEREVLTMQLFFLEWVRDRGWHFVYSYGMGTGQRLTSTLCKFVQLCSTYHCLTSC